ncbi:GD23728, related [Eimeria tenella]|uniref:GD23728, related n=1 Tax=Eimeria tenella TaxID=5802 RepID=U6KZV2_EIMTE|nr:GD23728, related [Eimeria tenella]CDJ43707.1 GD23728, related [Eimeria tenella]|eukprot:XP_013234456.1 GD23728, related [Eimeria tenella]
MLPDFQSGYISILNSVGSHPLQLWACCTAAAGASVAAAADRELGGAPVVELRGPLRCCCICCPPEPQRALKITLPVIVLLVKNLNKLFSFEVQIYDSKNTKRRFRASNFQKTTRIKPFLCAMPLRMDSGWVYVHLNLAELTRKAFGTHYNYTSRVLIHSSCRLQRVFFSEQPFREEQLPDELRLPLQETQS